MSDFWTGQSSFPERISSDDSNTVFVASRSGRARRLGTPRENEVARKLRWQRKGESTGLEIVRRVTELDDNSKKDITRGQ